MGESHDPIQPQRLRKLLRRLLDIYSPSGKEEDALHYLQGYLKRQGLPVSRQTVDENRYNLMVIPTERDVQAALIGHVDTVAAHAPDESVSFRQVCTAARIYLNFLREMSS
ncbi:MAG: hypothetical protein ABII06_15780 [Pseudomonadota bacterium]